MTTPLIDSDFYKQGHHPMYPEGTNRIYSNNTPRKSRIDGINRVVVFAHQAFVKKYILKKWTKKFFRKPWAVVAEEYKRMIDHTLGKDAVDLTHIKKLHDLGYMPLSIKSLPEGTICPIRVPMLTITNTVDHAFWLVNFLETILSCTVWQPITSATLSYEFRKVFNYWAMKTVGNTDFVPFQGHDFSMRGMSSLGTAKSSGGGHLLAFVGTDTVPAIAWLEKFYNADVTKELVGCSVPATEHSVMCMGEKDQEIATFERLLDLHPTGIISIVSDTWSLPYVVTEILPRLKDKIMARKGKVVIRPDSFWTDPVDCLCGYDGYHPQMAKMNEAEIASIREGLVEALWNLFGGTETEKGYKLLDEHIGDIYGDSISLERAEAICSRLEAKGFASINWVAGIGSFTYQFNTRDTFGFAVKATYGEVNGVGREIFKDPITDDGMKKSAKGLLRVDKVDGEYVLRDCVTKEEEAGGELREIFRDGKLLIDEDLKTIRERLASYL